MNANDFSTIELPDELAELTEHMAEAVHITWVASRVMDGWAYGAERNDNLKTHPGLVPYEKLPESEKEYDRRTAISTLKLILASGFKIEKARFPGSTGA